MGRIRVEVTPREGVDTTREAVAKLLRGLPGVEDVELVDAEDEGAFGFHLSTGAEDPRPALFDMCVEEMLILLARDPR